MAGIIQVEHRGDLAALGDRCASFKGTVHMHNRLTRSDFQALGGSLGDRSIGLGNVPINQETIGLFTERQIPERERQSSLPSLLVLANRGTH